MDQAVRDLAGHTWTNNALTIAKCLARCQSNSFTYAGVEFGKNCHCDNSYGTYGVQSDALCTTPCAGDSSTTCGGYWFNEIYSVGE